MTALTGAEERQPATDRHPTQPFTPYHRLQPSHQLSRIRTDHHHPVLQHSTRRGQRIPDIHRIQVLLGDMGSQLRGLCPQRFP
ncbi:hypothetical protein, partial [Streptomyces phaeochromogenes]